MKGHWKNVGILASCQLLFMSITSLMFTVGGLAGQALAEDKALATLPISTAVVGSALATVPASLLMRRVSRRIGFMVGCLMAMLGAVICITALRLENFWLLTLGTMTVGTFVAFAQLYRFAAADTVPESLKGRAISLVLAGGVLAGFTGPQLAKWTRELVPEVTYLGSYSTVIVLALATMVLLQFLDIPAPTPEVLRGEQRPLGKIAAQPVFIIAVASALVGYGVMSLLMTGTPLAMVGNQHSFNNAATVIQWHVVAMFAPSFFTGFLIERFGVVTIIVAGALLDLAAVGVGMTGVSMASFWGALVLLGFGWNFLYIGGSTLLTRAYTPSERAKTQATNDFLVSGVAALSSLSAGQLLHYLGWTSVVLSALPPIALVLALTLWFVLRKRQLGPAA